MVKSHNGPPYPGCPYESPDRVFFCKQSPLTSIACMRYRRGRPELSYLSSAKGRCPDEWQRRAARYALRASRSVVVSLSLLRRTPHLSPRKSHGSWFVKSLPVYSNGLWSNLSSGLPTWKPLQTYIIPE